MTGKILIVDDNEQITSLLKEILEMKGYDSVIASNASEALQIYNDNQFDTVITDMQLDKDNNGIDLIKKMKEIKEIPLAGINFFGMMASIFQMLARKQIFMAVTLVLGWA